MAKKLRFQHKPVLWTPEESEEMRLGRIKESRKNNGYSKKQFRKQYGQANTLSDYEALHTASVVMDIVDRHLCDHPFILLNKDAYKFAEEAHTALFNLYQCIGVLRSNADPEMLLHLNSKKVNNKSGKKN